MNDQPEPTPPPEALSAGLLYLVAAVLVGTCIGRGIWYLVERARLSRAMVSVSGGCGEWKVDGVVYRSTMPAKYNDRNVVVHVRPNDPGRIVVVRPEESPDCPPSAIGITLIVTGVLLVACFGTNRYHSRKGK